MKTIKFTPELTKLVQNGEKTATFRLFDDKNLTVGDEIILATRDGENIKEFGKGIITEVILRTLSTMQPEDFVGHEPVENSVEYYSQFYGDKVRPDSELKVVRFLVTEM